METSKVLTHSDLAQFTGDVERFRTLHPQVIYTPGVKFMADKGEAHWLIDAIASHYLNPKMKKAMTKDSRLRDMQFWRLVVTHRHSPSGGSAKLTMRADSDVAPAITQRIGFTDFPLNSVDIWSGFDGEFWTLYLPSEH